MKTPKRRWPRYSLRTMLFIVLMLSVWLGWMANQAAKQRRAVADIEHIGGSVRYHFERDGFSDYRPAEDLPGLTGSRCSAWLRNQLGLDFFHSVGSIELAFTEITDDTLRELLRAVPDLRSLELQFTDISDDGLENVVELPRLEFLNLSETKVTDHGLRDVGRCPRLRVLWLNHTSITDAGLAELEERHELACLLLDGTKVTDAALVRLATFKKLSLLTLQSTRVTDAGIERLQAELRNLAVLSDSGHHEPLNRPSESWNCFPNSASRSLGQGTGL